MKYLIKIFILNRKMVSLCNKLHMHFLARIIAYPRQRLCLSILKKSVKNSLAKNYNFNNLNEIGMSERKIFVMWLQGEEKMPEVIKICFESIKKASKNIGSVVLVTENNLTTLLELPDFILEKYNSGKITRTALSDIVRNGLLAKYGGVWIDSTVFLNAEIPYEYINKPYFCPVNVGNAVKTEWKYLYGESNGWTSWFCGSKYVGFPLFDFLYNAFLEFFKYNDIIIDYYQMDFLISLFYQNNIDFQKIVNSLNCNNICAYELMSLLEKKSSEKNRDYYTTLKQKGFINKITYKRNYQYKTNKGQETIYGWLFGEEKK